MVNFKLSTVSGDKTKTCSNFDNSLKYHSHDERIQLQAELYHQAKILNVECYLGQSIVFVGKPDAILRVMGKHYLVECGIKNIGDKRAVNQLCKYISLGCPIFIIYSVEQIAKLLHDLMNDIKFGNEIYVYDEDYQDFVFT